MRRLLLTAALLLTGCRADPPPPAAGPALWEVADEDTTVLMLGTLHALPDGVRWLHGPLADAAGGADELVLEIPPGSDGRDSAAAFQTLALRAPDPIRARVPAALRDELKASADAAGLTMVQLDHMDDWAAAVLLSGASATAAGLKRSNGVEEVLTRAFQRTGRPVSGLETPAVQFALFDRLPPASQRRYLADVLRDGGSENARLAGAVDDWASGDAAALGRLVNGELAGNPPLRAALLVRRNEAWAEWVRGRLDRPGIVLLAVGAGHLAGADSLQSKLAALGLTVRRIQ